jgi:hypothetical protein
VLNDDLLRRFKPQNRDRKGAPFAGTIDLLDRLKLLHEPPVNVVLDDKGRPAAEFQPAFFQHADPAAKVEDQQIVATRFEGPQVAAVQLRDDVVEQHGILANGVDAYLVQGGILEVDAVAAAENLGILHALQEAVDLQTAVGADGDAGIGKNGRWLDPQGQEDEIRRQTFAAIQEEAVWCYGVHDGAFVDGDAAPYQGAGDPAAYRWGKTGHENASGADGDARHFRPAGRGQLPDVAGDLGRGGTAADDDHLWAVPLEMIDESASGFHEPFDGFDAEKIDGRSVDNGTGNIATGVAGKDIVGHGVAV